MLRRYRAWNPVHPTAGAFWGFGLGLGCGVGWGPGFGPAAIGYVGAGCGAGLAVGVVLAGLGVGLPTRGLAAAPCDGDRPGAWGGVSGQQAAMGLDRTYRKGQTSACAFETGAVATHGISTWLDTPS
eukprot:SM000223S07297  [mRNA]  locus=s223:24270:24837:+ [translate_table: standard]